MKRSQLITGSSSPESPISGFSYSFLFDLLAAKPQLLVETSVTLDVFLAKIVKQALPAADELEQPASGGMITLESLEVLGDLVDACREHGHLDFWRARVVVGSGMLRDYLVLLSGL